MTSQAGALVALHWGWLWCVATERGIRHRGAELYHEIFADHWCLHGCLCRQCREQPWRRLPPGEDFPKPSDFNQKRKD